MKCRLVLTRMMNINVVGSILCAREAVKRMSSKHGGSGRSSSTFPRLPPPSVRHGQVCRLCRVEGRDRHCGRACARGQRRSSGQRDSSGPDRYEEIHAYGGDQTRAKLAHMVPMKRRDRRSTNAVVWPMSDDASYVTGTIFDVSWRAMNFAALVERRIFNHGIIRSSLSALAPAAMPQSARHAVGNEGKVARVEKWPTFGGTCLNVGCIRRKPCCRLPSVSRKSPICCQRWASASANRSSILQQ